MGSHKEKLHVRNKGVRDFLIVLASFHGRIKFGFTYFYVMDNNVHHHDCVGTRFSSVFIKVPIFPRKKNYKKKLNFHSGESIYMWIINIRDKTVYIDMAS